MNLKIYFEFEVWKLEKIKKPLDVYVSGIMTIFFYDNFVIPSMGTWHEIICLLTGYGRKAEIKS